MQEPFLTIDKATGQPQGRAHGSAAFLRDGRPQRSMKREQLSSGKALGRKGSSREHTISHISLSEKLFQGTAPQHFDMNPSK